MEDSSVKFMPLPNFQKGEKSSTYMDLILRGTLKSYSGQMYQRLQIFKFTLLPIEDPFAALLL